MEMRRHEVCANNKNNKTEVSTVYLPFRDVQEETTS